MSLIMVLLMIAYVALLYYMMRGFLTSHEESLSLEVLKTKEGYQKYLLQEDYALTEKRLLEDQFRELFTLYEMTKEMTKSFSMGEALNVFKEKLQNNASVRDCQLLEPLSPELTKLKNDPGVILFPLHGKKKLLGYVVVQGAEASEHDKIGILVNQFALVLRRIHLYEEVERLAITDSLTQVFTRRHFLDRFEEELKRARDKEGHLSFLMLDVDFFKQVNDQHGHLSGDRVLRTVAQRISENIREIDIAGRYGGEEFCVLLPDTDVSGACYAAERLRKAVEEKFIPAYDAEIKTTVSIGVSTFPQHGRKSSTLIDKADWALYRAKKNGRNQICVFGMYDEE
ncbi:MAG: GGDEF domain-containing protein [Candidatus Omnitrophota bacterium]